MRVESNTTTKDVMSNRRLSKRIPFRHKIKYGFWSSVWIGRTVNLSEGGIGIKANRAFPHGSKIVALLYMDDEVIEIEGVIAWVSPLPEILSTTALSTMGIKFLSGVDKIKHILRQMLEPCTTILS
jgi:Tfp pilus assembly protein PilZ